jgi:hypothetical protein
MTASSTRTRETSEIDHEVRVLSDACCFAGSQRAMGLHSLLCVDRVPDPPDLWAGHERVKTNP